MITPFSFTATTAMSAAMSAAQKLIVRSTSAADTMNETTVGVVSAVNTAETLALTGKRELRTANTYTTLTTFVLASAAAGTVTVRQLGTKGTAQLIVTTNPANNDTVTIGLAGFTQVYTFKSALTGAAYEVLIGAAASNTAENLRRALWNGNAARGDGVGAGTLYGTGTVANPYLEPTAISGQIITLSDLLECARQLAWSFTQSGTGLSLPSTLSGGVDGTLLASLTAGNTSCFNSFTLDDEALTGAKLPALFTGKSDWIGVFGRPILQLRSANLANGVSCSYEWSNDKTNYLSGTTSITALDNNAQYIEPGEKWLAYVRLNISTNANTTNSSINAKVVA
jgi:hypothetical protein